MWRQSSRNDGIVSQSEFIPPDGPDGPAPSLPERDYEVFIEGETLDLVIPTDMAVHRDRWHSWFNDPKVVQHSDHGLWPNTPEKQVAFLESTSHKETDRLVLLVRPKGARAVTGVVSLSGINWQHRMAQVGLVLGSGSRGSGGLFHGLEAKARIVEHAFEAMGLQRIWGSQARPLAEWQRFQLLFGFRIEGILRDAFRRGRLVHDLVISACLLTDYEAVLADRGAYWPGKTKLLEMMREVRGVTVVETVDRAIRDANAEFSLHRGDK
jgi:RimJ/RimL family protein N-acetyltransferase